MTGSQTKTSFQPKGEQTASTKVFLARYGVDQAALQAFEADASTRRYFRVPDSGMLLMEDRQDPQGFDAFIRLSAHLNALGLSAPKVIANDIAHGVALVEDFGDQTYATCLAAGQDERALYKLAVETLVHLHHASQATHADQPRYDLDTHLTELEIFLDWFLPALGGVTDRDRFKQRFLSLWSDALADAGRRFDTLVLRDFHVDNLMLLADRHGVARCGLLDFQDGVLGPCEYDLVSLLQDARRDLAPGLEQELLDFYIQHAPEHLGSAADIRHRYAVLGAQRHARILGVFVRLCQRDGKPRYLSFIPRVLRQFQTALSDAGLIGISELLEQEMPDWSDKALQLDEEALKDAGAGA